MTRLAKYSAELYVKLEEETGVATGMRQCGSITVALTESAQEEIFRQASLARAFDIDVQEIGPDEVLKMYPHLNIDDVVGGCLPAARRAGRPCQYRHGAGQGCAAAGRGSSRA
jgi:glycine/D-amino acid oxidase-like deaminating enzyme